MMLAKGFKTYQDVFWVGDGSNDSCCEHELFPSFSNVDDMDSFSVAFIDVWSHQVSAVLGSNVCLKKVINGKKEVRWRQS